MTFRWILRSILTAGMLSGCGTQAAYSQSNETEYRFEGQLLSISSGSVIRRFDGGEEIFLSSKLECSTSEYSCVFAAFPFVVPKGDFFDGVEYGFHGYNFYPECAAKLSTVCDAWIIRFVSIDRRESEVADQGFFIYEPQFGVRAFARFDNEQGPSRKLSLGPVWYYADKIPLLAPDPID
ncbi:MAG: hypothetical protein KF910_01720 [Brevundimonas sp.]|uniref:hypothetical protein n=1 Tax=Brevundimonas sp. TaxID=1871086 RepID=UPI0025B95017|nr:hypothetical protein [Brevundimonas sp.]MBX3476301.1 hypothetical protein [Brevundimonas sp.]